MTRANLRLPTCTTKVPAASFSALSLTTRAVDAHAAAVDQAHAPRWSMAPGRACFSSCADAPAARRASVTGVDLVGHAALARRFEVVLRRVGRCRAVEARGDLLGQQHLGVLRVAARLRPRASAPRSRPSSGSSAASYQRHISVVADRQHLGEHGVGVLGDADVVVLATSTSSRRRPGPRAAASSGCTAAPGRTPAAGGGPPAG